ncbi:MULTISPECIES: hypothetical protein [unclassified Streptomyces]|uniref:hypothetical protein n=1 Tax=unclassified Streptomyces TaxID=2593676 RepID=UPI0036B80293
METRGTRAEAGAMQAVWDQTCVVRPKCAPENELGTSKHIVAATTPNQTTNNPA